MFARGLLKRLVTRIYFPDEAEANEADPVLSSVADPQARSGLVAVEEAGGLRFDITLQGDRETTFFAVRAAVRAAAYSRGDRRRRLAPGHAGLRGRAGARAGARRARPASRSMPPKSPPPARSTSANPAAASGRGAARSRSAHRGATSQDVIDTRVDAGAKRALPLIEDELAARRRRLRGPGRRASRHADGRPHAAPAGPAHHLRAEGRGLAGGAWTRPGTGWPPCRSRSQLGGAAGTLRIPGRPRVGRAGAPGSASSTSPSPVLPWHTRPGPRGQLGCGPGVDRRRARRRSRST